MADNPSKVTYERGQSIQVDSRRWLGQVHGNAPLWKDAVYYGTLPTGQVITSEGIFTPDAVQPHPTLMLPKPKEG